MMLIGSNVLRQRDLIKLYMDGISEEHMSWWDGAKNDVRISHLSEEDDC